MVPSLTAAGWANFHLWKIFSWTLQLLFSTYIRPFLVTIRTSNPFILHVHIGIFSQEIYHTVHTVFDWLGSRTPREVVKIMDWLWRHNSTKNVRWWLILVTSVLLSWCACYTTKSIFYGITMVLFCKGQTAHRTQTQAAHTGNNRYIHKTITLAIEEYKASLEHDSNITDPGRNRVINYHEESSAVSPPPVLTEKHLRYQICEVSQVHSRPISSVTLSKLYVQLSQQFHFIIACL